MEDAASSRPSRFSVTRVTVLCGVFLFFMCVVAISPSATRVDKVGVRSVSDTKQGPVVPAVPSGTPDADDDDAAVTTAAPKRRRRRRRASDATGASDSADVELQPTTQQVEGSAQLDVANAPPPPAVPAVESAPERSRNCGLQQDPRPHISAAPLPPWVLADPYRIRTPADGDVFMTPNARTHHEKYFASVIIYPPNEVRDMVARSGMFAWLRRPSDKDLLRPRYREGACWTSSAESQLDSEAVNNRQLWQHGAQTAFTPPEVVYERMQPPSDGIHLVPVVLIMNPVGTSNFEADFAVYELIPPGGVVVAIFTTDNVLNPHDSQLETMREYLRIPGVARVYNPWTYFMDREDPSCVRLRRLAEFIQPHYVYGVGDERGRNVCPGRTYLQSYADPKRKLQVYEAYKRFTDSAIANHDQSVENAGDSADKMLDVVLTERQRAVDAERRRLVPMYGIRSSLLTAPRLWRAQIAAQGQTTYFVPSVTVHYKTHGAQGVHHCPFFHSGDTFPRPLRRRGESISGLTFNGWPLPIGLPGLTPASDSSARAYSYEAKRTSKDKPFAGVAPDTLRPKRSQFESSEAEWREATQRATENPGRISEDFWKFPPRNVWPFEVAPFERPRRYAWALMGKTGYGGRAKAVMAFRSIFGDLPNRVNGESNLDRSLRKGRTSRWEHMLSDTVFAPVGGGTMTFETARPYDAARCGAIPVVVSHQQDLDITYRNLLGFEGQYPDGWIVGHSWEHAARLAKQALETPGEVQRLRRLVLHGYERMRNALHAHVRRGMDFARAQDPQSLWDEAYAEFGLGTPNP